ncbi:MAG: hypothetical protein K8R53_02215 [Bacteroidales bacterium]|nr:hypothetical protein [Bacteroidales bacterium]
MNRKQFIEYVKDPGELDSESLPILKELVANYPYCQTAGILYLLNLYKVDHIGYGDQLRFTAAIASDRSFLKNLIGKVRPSEIIKDGQKSNIGYPKPYFQEQSVPSENIPEYETDKEPVEVINLIDHLQEKAESFDVTGGSEQGKYLLLQDLIFKLEDIVKTFLSEKEPGGQEAARLSTEYSLDHLEDVNTAPEIFKSKRELIDKFINSDSQVSSSTKKPFFTPEKSANDSSMENDSIVSETLAKIFYRQGNYKRAIAIFKKLSLLNPGKSNYFAAQILKIEKEIDN